MDLRLAAIVRAFRSSTIRTRLFVSFVLLVLLPAIAFGTVSSVAGFSSGRQRVIDQLESVATLKEAELDTWVGNLQSDLAAAQIGAEAMQYMRDVLAPSTDPARTQVAYDQLHQRFTQMVDQSQSFEELFLMNRQQTVVLSTDRQREGRFGTPGSQIYLQKGLQGPYLHPPSYTLSVGGIAVMAVRPVYDQDGQALGILAGRASPRRLNEIMLERAGLGETGETYLVTGSHIMLTEPRFREQRWYYTYYVFTDSVDAALEKHVDGSGTYESYRHVPVIGVYRWLPRLEVALLAEQSEAEAMGATYVTLGINVGVAIATLLIAAVVSVLLARSIVRPLSDLVESARRVSRGDLKHGVKMEREDEIGVLAQAFNDMTAQLRDLIDGLEQRVEERTQALHRQTLQLQTSTQVSREITSILDIGELLTRVVTLIKEAFGYRYVGIFLVDAQANALVFGAGTGEVGERWKRSGRQLGIGAGSLNGEVAYSNQAAVVNDVSQDPRYLADVPDTRAEMVIPLRMGERLVGTLDVQSTEINAFSDADVRIVQSLGDQIAIAIENARLYDRSRELAVIEERSRLARELHDSVIQLLYSLTLLVAGWLRSARAGRTEDLQDHLAEVGEVAQQALKEMRLLIHELRPSVLEKEGLVGALHQRLDAVERRAGMEARLLAEELVQLPPHVEKELYCIAQEALNNALRHAAASSVMVYLRARNGQVELEVADNGRGFDLEAAKLNGGIGLTSIRERAEQLGGLLTIRSLPGEGTSVQVRVDIHAGLREVG